MLPLPKAMTDLIVVLTNKTIIPFELWEIIFSIKDDMEHSEWEEKMRYLFSNEYCYSDPNLRTRLRSGRTYQRGFTGGAKVYNLATQTLNCETYENKSYFKLKGLFDLTKKYYIWLYKREKWCCHHNCLPDRCAPWCKFSQERREKNRQSHHSWERFFDTVDNKIDSMVMSVMLDYRNYERVLPIKKILHKKIKNYNFDCWDADEEQSQIRDYENLMRRIKNTYNTIPRFLDCVVIANKLDYFKNVYFKNWKNLCMTQADFQFEMSIYYPTEWKKYHKKCKKLRGGKLVGPRLTGASFCASC